jgi:hypothetical protein
VLTIDVPLLEQNNADLRRRYAARGIALDNVTRSVQQVVQPDGCVSIEGIGSVRVCGLTAEEAQIAIIKKAFEAQPEASREAFGVAVDVASKNSKQAYVVIHGGACGENVCTIPATGEETVNCALRKSVFPHPIDFAKATICVARPDKNGQIELPVEWSAEKGGPTCESNHVLLPGDRVFVQLPTEPTPPVPPTPVATWTPAAHPAPVPYCAPSITAAPQPPQPYSPIIAGPPSVPSTTFYSAVPAAVPSPFAAGPSLPRLSTSLIDTQAYLTSTPLLAPPAPAATSPIASASSSCASDSCAGSSCAGSSCAEAAPAKHAAQVLFNVDVIEDFTGSFREFSALQSGMPILTADSEIILPTIRILEKQNLVRRRSGPTLVTLVGRPARVQVGVERPSEDDSPASFDGVILEAVAHEYGGGLNVEFQYRDTSGRDALEVETSLLLSHGQTIIMRTSGRKAQKAEGDDRSANGDPVVYVVLTPELIR